MNESGELLLVRLEKRLKTLFDNQAMDRQDREKLEETLVELRDSINDIVNRLNSVEDILAKSEPTVEEFITISLPADIAPGTTAISLSAAVLVHSAGSVDLGELAISRDLKSNENAP